MNNRLEEIKKLLPDNDNGDITEKDMRDAFAMTFDEMANSLAKPTGHLSEPNAIFKYVLLLDENGNSNRTLAQDLGKNTANSKLTSVAGAGLVLGDIWGIKTNGFPFRIEDLPDVTNRPTHQKKLMIGDDNTAGTSDKADINFELPNTMTVNHIYPQINEPVVYPAELAEFLKTYRTKQFTQMREEDWFYNYNENDITPLKLFGGNVITTASSIRAGSNGVQVGNWSLMSKKFPFNKKFIIELNISASDHSGFHSYGTNNIGICQNGNESSFNQAFSDFFVFSSAKVTMGKQSFDFKGSFRVIFAHIQDTLFIVALSGEAGKMASKISNINDFFGDFSILMKGGFHAFSSPNRTGIEMKYWVES